MLPVPEVAQGYLCGSFRSSKLKKITHKGKVNFMQNFSLNGNWVDLVIILVLVYFASEAWRHGLWVILADFASFLGALLISFRAYKFTAGFFRTNFSLFPSISNSFF